MTNFFGLSLSFFSQYFVKKTVKNNSLANYLAFISLELTAKTWREKCESGGNSL